MKKNLNFCSESLLHLFSTLWINILPPKSLQTEQFDRTRGDKKPNIMQSDTIDLPYSSAQTYLPNYDNQVEKYCSCHITENDAAKPYSN